MYEEEIQGLVGKNIFQYEGKWPVIGEGVFIAPGAIITGDLVLGEYASVWYNAVIRADVHYVRIGHLTNVQDGAILHVTHDTNPLIIGDMVTIGHGAILHGCTIGNRVLIGMGSTVLDGAIIEDGSMIGAGAVVSPGTHIPSGSLALGIPAKVVRTLKPHEIAELTAGPERYKLYAQKNRAGVANSRS